MDQDIKQTPERKRLPFASLVGLPLLGWAISWTLGSGMTLLLVPIAVWLRPIPERKLALVVGGASLRTLFSLILLLGIGGSPGIWLREDGSPLLLLVIGTDNGLIEKYALKGPFYRGDDPIEGRPFRQQGAVVYSVGPDMTDQRGALSYDPTNGIYSAGDIVLQVLPNSNESR